MSLRSSVASLRSSVASLRSSVASLRVSEAPDCSSEAPDCLTKVMIVSPDYGSVIVRVWNCSCLDECLELVRTLRAGTEVTLFNGELSKGWRFRSGEEVMHVGCEQGSEGGQK